MFDEFRRAWRARGRTEEYANELSSRRGFYVQVFGSVDDMVQSGLVPMQATNRLEQLRPDIVQKLGHDPESTLTAFLRPTDGKISFLWWVSFTVNGGYKGLKRYELDSYEGNEVAEDFGDNEEGFELI